MWQSEDGFGENTPNVRTQEFKKVYRTNLWAKTRNNQKFVAPSICRTQRSFFTLIAGAVATGPALHDEKEKNAARGNKTKQKRKGITNDCYGAYVESAAAEEPKLLITYHGSICLCVMISL